MSAAAIAASARTRLEELLGGRARRQVIILLALVVALDAADKATLGAVAAELQSKLGIPRDVATAAASERATA